MLEDFRVPRRGYGRRRWRERVLDELMSRFGPAIDVERSDIDLEASLLETEGRASGAAARQLAEQRLKRGAIFGQIAVAYGIEVQQTHINRAMMEEARRRSPVEADVIGFFRSNYNAMANLQANIVERLVTDLILEKAAR